MGNWCCDESLRNAPNLSEEKIPVSNHPEQSEVRSTILKPDDFQSRKYLGKGSFGSVVLVKRKHVKSDRLYAMKIIDKSQIKEKNLLQTDLIEKMLCHVPNPFLVEVVHTFQNSHKIYIVMEYVEGGDLYYYLAHQHFDEDTIRKLVPQIVEGLQYLHDNDVVYRDLKPENVLVTLDGHIKLTDFGLACKHYDRQPLYTYAGILEYMAPEVIQKKGIRHGYAGYDKMVDLWSLGVLLYELKHGYTPFRERDCELTRRNILTKSCEFDPSCSTDFVSLLHQLLMKNPLQRMTISQLKSHPFLKDKVDWNQVRQRTNEPPMRELIKRINIKFKGAEDTSNRTVTIVKTHERSFLPQLYEFSHEQDSLI